MAEVVIMAGPSGAGKSTWVDSYVGEDRVVCSSDLYHRDPDTGDYNWRQEHAREAHRLCFRKFLRELAEAHPARDGKTVVVDNTNTTADQIAPYIAAAMAYGFQPRVVIFLGSEEKVLGRNLHGTPDHVVFRMVEQTRDLVRNWPPYWPAPTLAPIS